MKHTRDLEPLLPVWIKKVRDDYRRRGMSEVTTARFTAELFYTWEKYHLDLSRVKQAELLKHTDAYQKHVKRNSYRLHVVILKKALKIIGREELAEKLIIPKREDTTKNIEILSREDRQKLIRQAASLQERLIIELLDTTGGRRGELWKLRIRDVQWDKYSAIVMLDGKTGTRRRRVYSPIAEDLREQINTHPNKQDPDASLFYFQDGYRARNRAYPMNSLKFYRIVTRMGQRILKRPIHPHLFRHTRATEDASNFTDREMMLLFGWKRPEQVSTYAHLRMRDVDNKDLALHGLISKEQILKPIVNVQVCGSCEEQNAPFAMYCKKCGTVLTGPQMEEMQEKLASIDLRTKFLEDPDTIKKLRNNKEFVQLIKDVTKT